MFIKQIMPPSAVREALLLPVACLRPCLAVLLLLLFPELPVAPALPLLGAGGNESRVPEG